MSEPDFHFTFHFSNFQYPLSQDTGWWWFNAIISIAGVMLATMVNHLSVSWLRWKHACDTRCQSLSHFPLELFYNTSFVEESCSYCFSSSLLCSLSMCCFTSLALGSDLLHSGQFYLVVLPLCILGNSFAFLWSLCTWFFKPIMLANLSLHWSHLKAFFVAPKSSVSVSM